MYSFLHLGIWPWLHCGKLIRNLTWRNSSTKTKSIITYTSSCRLKLEWPSFFVEHKRSCIKMPKLLLKQDFKSKDFIKIVCEQWPKLAKLWHDVYRLWNTLHEFYFIPIHLHWKDMNSYMINFSICLPQMKIKDHLIVDVFISHKP